MPHLTIGKLAERSGVSTDTLRYWEKMDLLEPGTRTASGYRMYHYDMVRVVRFIQGAKALHFTLAEIRGLLKLSSSDPGTCKNILKRTEAKIYEAQAKIAELQEIKKVVSQMVDTPAAPRASVMDHLRRHTRLVGIAVVAVLSCFGDVAYASDERLHEDECVRVESSYKRHKYAAA